MLTRKESSDGRRAHFARWPGSYTKDNSNCGHQVIADSKRESMDYAHFFSNFETFLNEAQREVEPYFIVEVKTEKGELMPDFVIIHTNENSHGLAQTNIHIVDENNRRKKRLKESSVDGDMAEIAIRISEYTFEQLNDFQRGGIERLEMEWGHVLRLKSAHEKEKEVEDEVS